MFGHGGASTLTRSRWAGIGAAVAVSLGAGGVGLIAHADSSAPTSFVSITPCRLFDTRPAADNVGDRSTPLQAGEELVRQVRGTNGSCTIPATAIGISYNMTVPTAIDGFVTVYPADASRPVTSSINPVAGEGVKANGGIVGLSATGAIKVYTLTGPLDALFDITGYFLPATSSAGVAGPRGLTGPSGVNGADGVNGIDGVDGARGLSAWDVIPSGQTVTGSIVFDIHAKAGVSTDSIGVDLPGVAPVALTDEAVNFSATSGAGDAEPDCDGTETEPTAPPGQVCIYIAATGGVDLNTLFAFSGLLSTRSFLVTFDTTLIDPLVDDEEYIYATWAYKAPL